MGMSIENAITWLNTDDFESKGFADATSVAIETMRKYQRIEEIMHKVYTSDNADVCLVQRLAEIREVMEDGSE